MWSDVRLKQCELPYCASACVRLCNFVLPGRIKTFQLEHGAPHFFRTRPDKLIRLAGCLGGKQTEQNLTKSRGVVLKVENSLEWMFVLAYLSAGFQLQD